MRLRTRSGCTLLAASLFSLMLGCLLFGMAAMVLTPDDWLMLAGMLPQPQAPADETDAPPPVAITLSPVAVVAPDSAAADSAATGGASNDGTTGNNDPPDAPLPAAPTATPAPAPTVSAAQVNFVAELMRPLVDEAQRRRAERASSDPQGYAKRVDKQLNQSRVNFLIFGYGTTYEPPYPPTYKGSIAVYSLDMRTLQVGQITLNHDIRSPEIERFQQQHSAGKVSPAKIDLAYQSGGFDLMRLATEDATGLSVDFQLAFQDSVVKEIVDEVFDGLIVNVPYAFDAAPIVFDNKLYPALHYAQGKQRLNGLQTLQFIKAINAQLGKTRYDPTKELATRKQFVVQGVLDAIKRETTNPIFWAKMLSFLRSTLDRREIEYDFDAGSLLFKTINQYIASGARGQKIPISVTRNVYVVDGKIGDGGVQWVTGSLNPIMVRDLKNGVYGDISMSVPLGKADPNAADLPTGYWTSVRQLIRQRLAP